MRIALLGAGIPGLAAALAAADGVDALLVLDGSGERARAVAEAEGAGRAEAASVDPADRQALTLALEPYDVVVGAAGAGTALAVMDACVASGTAYMELAAGVDVAGRRSAMGDAFAERGLLAVLGVPAAAAAGLVARYARGRLPYAGVLGAEEIDATEVP
jgi:saccharopine dehydrogenase-like NADP-dependent oxidoreductase